MDQQTPTDQTPARPSLIRQVIPWLFAAAIVGYMFYQVNFREVLSALTAPDTRPSTACAAKRSITRRDPPNRPLACTPVSTVPVRALSIRASVVLSTPRIDGFSSVPRASAATATGPDRSNSSTPVSRQSVSAGPL